MPGNEGPALGEGNGPGVSAGFQIALCLLEDPGILHGSPPDHYTGNACGFAPSANILAREQVSIPDHG